ncbi:MAG: phosphate acetyltransferase [Actinomycetaceae bacterium]|nr:phosphate acetyltransferase [Actinomycetaceae bacterium]
MNSFISDITKRAQKIKKRILLPEAEDDRVLRAASIAHSQGIAEIILLGDKEEITSRADQLAFNLNGITIISPDDEELHTRYAHQYASLRAHKGVTIDDAHKQLEDISYFATMMLAMGDADGLVSGASHTTADTLRPAFQIIKTHESADLVSSAFFMVLGENVWVFADCAVNTNPTPSQLASIASASITTARQFDIDPHLAFLSYSTGISGSGPDVDAVKEATKLAQELCPHENIDGPLQFDAAVDETTAHAKAPNSLVAGKANIFIFPSLEAGNIAYKVMQRTAGAEAIGPILQGLALPVNDLSRGALVDDIVNTIAITAIQAQSINNT